MISYGEEATMTFDPEAITFSLEQRCWKWPGWLFPCCHLLQTLSKDCD